MKHVKKLLAMVLALVMVMSLAVSAFAAEITIKVVTSDSGASVEGHDYEVYQIFTGDVAEDGKTLSNVAFGQNYNPSGKTVDAALAELEEMKGTDAAAFLAGAKVGEPFGYLNDDNNHQITAPTGYYLIIDVTEGLPSETETKSAYILQALENVEIKSKHDSTMKTFKKIDDVNDSSATEEVEIEWHDGADHDIGDLIDFQLNAVIPSSIGAFRAAEPAQAYPFTFHDVECEGLDFQGIKVTDGQAQVYVLNGIEKTYISADQYSVVENVTHEDAENCTFEVRFTDLTQIAAVTSGSVLVVEYQSELTEDAVTGSTGNPNKMRGEFRNYNKPDEPVFTPWDTVIAFTYKVNVDKYSNEVGEGNELEGAMFTLYKEVLSTYPGAQTGAAIKATFTNPSIKADALDDAKYYVIAQTVETDPDGDSFEFKGIDDGNYVLVETTIPDGYNAWEAVAFVVTAEHDVDEAEGQEVARLISLDGGELATGEVSTGSIHADIINNSGVELPETGGIGTTIFYVLGSAMVVVAVVFLVTKKRMGNAE